MVRGSRERNKFEEYFSLSDQLLRVWQAKKENVLRIYQSENYYHLMKLGKICMQDRSKQHNNLLKKLWGAENLYRAPRIPLRQCLVGFSVIVDINTKPTARQIWNYFIMFLLN